MTPETRFEFIGSGENPVDPPAQGNIVSSDADEELQQDIRRDRELAALRNAIRACSTPYESDTTVLQSDRIPLGFHKAFWGPRNEQMLRGASSLRLASPVPVFGSDAENAVEQGRRENGQEKWRPAHIEYHRIGAYTIAVRWDLDGDDYLLFAGWPGSIIYDLALITRYVKDGGDMNTDLWYLVHDSKYALGKNGERTELIRSILDRQNACAGQSTPALFAKTSDSLTMAAIRMSHQSISTVRALAERNFIPACQAAFGLGGYHGILFKTYGVDIDNAPTLRFLAAHHPICTVYPGLYANCNGVIADESACVLTGTIAALSELFSNRALCRMLPKEELELLRSMGIAQRAS
jgi:hypothetical protein